MSSVSLALAAPAASPRPLPLWLLEQEARAMLTRLDRVKPFALQETMVPAANLMPAAQVAIDRYLMNGRRGLRRQVTDYIRWLRGAGRSASPAGLQRRFSVLRLQFNTALSQLDLFSEAITQRSEHETGVWLSGLDVAAQDALKLAGSYYHAPPVICYVHRGLGGAIRRARTRLPGGGQNPVAVIRIPRERMIGYGLSSSLVHEVGHQAAALLGLVESLRPVLQEAQRRVEPRLRTAWHQWERWISEIVADFWALAKVGIASTLGLIGIVSLPRAFVFRIGVDDPHPFPWIRVKLSCAMGNALYPHPQWDELDAVWESFYPRQGLDPARAAAVDALVATIPAFVGVLLNHRPASLGGTSLREAVALPDRAPARLIQHWKKWTADPSLIRAAPPTLLFAVLARARVTGKLSPEKESHLLGKLITYWALRSTLDVAEFCASQQVPSPPAFVPDVFGRRHRQLSNAS